MYSLSFTGFLNNTEFNNIWSPLGIEPRTACIVHKRSATELRQPPGEQTLQLCIYTVKSYGFYSKTTTSVAVLNITSHKPHPIQEISFQEAEANK